MIWLCVVPPRVTFLMTAEAAEPEAAAAAEGDAATAATAAAEEAAAAEPEEDERAIVFKLYELLRAADMEVCTAPQHAAVQHSSEHTKYVLAEAAYPS
jgi:hypothetical protein